MLFGSWINFEIYVGIFVTVIDYSWLQQIVQE